MDFIQDGYPSSDDQGVPGHERLEGGGRVTMFPVPAGCAVARFTARCRGPLQPRLLPVDRGLPCGGGHAQKGKGPELYRGIMTAEGKTMGMLSKDNA